MNDVFSITISGLGKYSIKLTLCNFHLQYLFCAFSMCMAGDRLQFGVWNVHWEGPTCTALNVLLPD
jgi:hypothetical protein